MPSWFLLSIVDSHWCIVDGVPSFYSEGFRVSWLVFANCAVVVFVFFRHCRRLPAASTSCLKSSRLLSKGKSLDWTLARSFRL